MTRFDPFWLELESGIRGLEPFDERGGYYHRSPSKCAR